LVAVTVAPATTAPLGSVTVPEMLAVTPASNRPHVNSANAQSKTAKYFPNRVLGIPHPPSLSTLDRIGPCEPADLRLIPPRFLIPLAIEGVKTV
jgi:hypothetical protein